jgi:hypothetical protein
MKPVIGTVYYHKRLKIRVTVLAIYPDVIWVRAEDDQGNSFLTPATDLQEIVSMSMDEILRREG